MYGSIFLVYLLENSFKFLIFNFLFQKLYVYFFTILFILTNDNLPLYFQLKQYDVY